jgi:hypothetical protein
MVFSIKYGGFPVNVPLDQSIDIGSQPVEITHL